MSSESSRYLVGIDLGTTNSSLSFIDQFEPEKGVQTLQIEQWHSEGRTTESEYLPSYCYFLTKSEVKRSLFTEPFGAIKDKYLLGTIAKDRMSESPERVIASAKSWLGYNDRTDPRGKILPWNSDDILGNDRLSPIEVSSFILSHLTLEWERQMTKGDEAKKLSKQNIVITVPASFDEAAQSYTLEAASQAGLSQEKIRLLEEPAAAFYAWRDEHPDKSIQGKVLVCDIGGGTSDFSLFEVDSQNQLFKRLSVSDHILLGGDSLDLAIAHQMESQLTGVELSSRQWAILVSKSKELKEKVLLDENLDQELFVTLPGSGSNLFASNITLSIKAGLIREIILDGFFPFCDADASPESSQAGLKNLGLPYASDSAVTKHIADFLRKTYVDAVLFAGGSMKSELIRSRVTDVISSWQNSSPEQLQTSSVQNLVSKGAALEGSFVGRPQKISGGYPRTLFLKTQNPEGLETFVSLIPKGHTQKITKVKIPGLQATLGTQVAIEVAYSTRERITTGDFYEGESKDLKKLPPLSTAFQVDKKHNKKLIPVILEVELLSTGNPIIRVKPESQSLAEDYQWDLNFDSLESSFDTLTHSDDSLSPKSNRDACNLIESIYGKKPPQASLRPQDLIASLEALLGLKKEDWDTPTLRMLFDTLIKNKGRRARTDAHERIWYNLAGFCLRPGFGAPGDPGRVSEFWKLYHEGPKFKQPAITNQWLILLRRISGGLKSTWQQTIFDKYYPDVRKNIHLSPETYLLLASLERIPMQQKIQLGNKLVDQILNKKNSLDQKIWALARIASRSTFSSHDEHIVRPKFVIEWSERLNKIELDDKAFKRMKLFYLQAGRLLDDREFDLPLILRQDFCRKLEELKAPQEEINLLLEFTPVDDAYKASLYGEALPLGFTIVGE